MQELQQIERIYSFEEICPEFSQILAENGGWEKCRDLMFETEDGKVKSIQDGKSCIVGEAHGN